VLARLRARGMAERTNVMSFSPEIVAGIRLLAPGQRTTLLVGRNHLESAAAGATEIIALARGFGVTDFGPGHTLLDAEVVAATRAAGLGLIVWTPNDEPEIRRLTALGVDILTTDRPDLALRLRDLG